MPARRPVKPKSVPGAAAAEQGATYCYKYPRPAVTVDLVVFGLDGPTLKVALIRRKHDPFAGRWAIPGGFLEMDETAEAAARRELIEEAGLVIEGAVSPIGAFSQPGRDPRGRTISLVHAAVVRAPLPLLKGADDADEAAWLDPDQVAPLAFDHDEVMIAARRWLIGSLKEGRTPLEILPDPFQADQAEALFLALGQTKRSARAWIARSLRESRNLS